MPLTLPLNTTNEKYFVIGTDANGIKGAQLGPGQTIAVTVDNPEICGLGTDTPALPDNEGTASIASGGVNPVAVGGPVNATWTVKNADGSTAETDTDTITVTAPVAGVATSIGVLFETPVSAGAGLTPAGASPIKK